MVPEFGDKEIPEPDRLRSASFFAVLKPGIVGLYYLDALKLLYEVCPELVEKLAAQGCLLGKLSVVKGLFL